MPHFENSGVGRGAPIVSANVMRDFGARDHLSWRHLALIRRHWPGPWWSRASSIRRMPCAPGRSAWMGIIVSNHGGRQLDGSVAPLAILPQVVKAVGSDYPVMIDSGFRRGGDILMALALGATFVFVGRPMNYAGAVGGHRASSMRSASWPPNCRATWRCWGSRVPRGPSRQPQDRAVTTADLLFDDRR